MGGKVTRGTRRWRGSDIGQYCICSTNKGGRCFLWDRLPLLYFSACYPRAVTLTCHPVIYDRQTLTNPVLGSCYSLLSHAFKLKIFFECYGNFGLTPAGVLVLVVSG